MTHNGYSFKRPTLKSNYIQLLFTIKNLNQCGYCPTRKQLRQAVTFDVADVWNQGRGFRKILQNLTEKGYVKETNSGQLLYTDKGFDLLVNAVDSTVASYYGRE